MRKIGLEEQKKILIDMLKYIDEVCRKNKINYSLMYGSLIGAIRHNGIIPWDDDIDIGLVSEEYDKLMDALEKDNDSYYKILDPERNKNYAYPFAKLVDTRTTLIEKGVKEIDDYGVYIDIFRLHYVSNNSFFRKMHYKILFFTETVFARAMLYPKYIKNIKSKLIVIIANIIGVNFLKKRHLKLCVNKKKTDYVICDWPEYGVERETFKRSSFDKYKRVKFENIEAMIVDDYDSVLRTTFGDYMQLPPEEERSPRHNTEIYWKK